MWATYSSTVLRGVHLTIDVSILLSRSLVRCAWALFPALSLVVDYKIFGDESTEHKYPIFLSHIGLLVGVTVDVWEVVVSCHWHSVETKSNETTVKKSLEEVVECLVDTLFWDIDLPQVALLQAFSEVTLEVMLEISVERVRPTYENLLENRYDIWIIKCLSSQCIDHG